MTFVVELSRSVLLHVVKRILAFLFALIVIAFFVICPVHHADVLPPIAHENPLMIDDVAWRRRRHSGDFHSADRGFAYCFRFILHVVLVLVLFVLVIFVVLPILGMTQMLLIGAATVASAFATENFANVELVLLPVDERCDLLDVADKLDHLLLALVSQQG